MILSIPTILIWLFPNLFYDVFATGKPCATFKIADTFPYFPWFRFISITREACLPSYAYYIWMHD